LGQNTGIDFQGQFCNVSNVVIKDPWRGIRYGGSADTDAQGNTLCNVVVTGHTREAFVSTTEGHDILVSNFIAYDADGAALRHFRIEGDGNTFRGTWGDDSNSTVYSVAAGSAVETFTRDAPNANYNDTLDLREIVSGRAGITARGPSTNIDVSIETKGTGVLRVGTHTAIGAETLSGYITIKDQSGTSRKIGVIS